jgi:flagellar biosynthesis activator protein FlaF
VTALDQALAAYGASARVTRTPRDTEFDVLARITRRLKSAAAPGAAFADLAHAIHDNRSLWGIFALDLALPGNGLPPDLRARLLSIARFVEDHSSKVLRDAASADVLVDINTAVMRGLRPAEVQP